MIASSPIRNFFPKNIPRYYNFFSSVFQNKNASQSIAYWFHFPKHSCWFIHCQLFHFILIYECAAAVLKKITSVVFILLGGSSTQTQTFTHPPQYSVTIICCIADVIVVLCVITVPSRLFYSPPLYGQTSWIYIRTSPSDRNECMRNIYKIPCVHLKC